MTAEEVRRLRDYVARTQQGKPLSLEEAQDFYRLSKKLEGEEAYKREVGTILLVGLAAFVLGLLLGSRTNGKG